MGGEGNWFGDTAKSLARNPLSIIALFIVLVYALASLVTAFADSFTTAERLPLIYFLAIFPVIVLGIFAWLVSRHSNKLYGPLDFKNEDNYVKMQLAIVASLSAATAKAADTVEEWDIRRIVETARSVEPEPSSRVDDWRNRILWVDDRPNNNVNERRAFEAVGFRFTLAESTDEAFQHLSRAKFAAVISDMGRREGPREGYALLDRLRREGDSTPLFFYAASNSPEHKRETREHGGQGCTNNAQELFAMVINALR